MAKADENSEAFRAMAPAVARELWGEPNKKLSKPDNLRFGSQGSISVDTKTGQVYDHESKEGGGILWAVERETGAAVDGGAAVEWLREHGFYVPDDRDNYRPAGGAGGAGKASGDRKDRFDAKGNWLPQQVPDTGELVAIYPYTDAKGKLVYETCRFEWPDAENPKGHGKTFLQRQPGTSQGRYKWNLKGITPLLYRLPELLADIAEGEQVFFVEGEKKVDMLRELGIPATCNSGGAGKFPEALAEALRGAKLVIIPDNDDSGREHAKLVGNAVEGLAASCKVLELPGLGEKESVDNWLPAGGTPEKLYDLAASAPLFIPGDYQSKFGAVTWEHLDDPGPHHEELIKGVLTRNELAMLLGQSQSGKSFIAIDVGMAVARGTEWQGRKVRQGMVIYQAGESAKGVRRLRLRAYRQQFNCASEAVPFVLLQKGLDLYKSDEDTDAFIEECQHWRKRSPLPLELIVIDTFNKATPGANENDGKDMGIVLQRCDRIREATGATVLLVHHLNAAGNKARGHTSLFANLENVLLCRIREDSHDADNRQVREVVIAKQKEGEDGIAFPFVLPSITIDHDSDNEPVTSCFVAPPAGAPGANMQLQGIRVGGQTALVLRVIYDVITREGIFAPAVLGLEFGWHVATRQQIGEALEKTKVLREDDDTAGLGGAEAETDEERRKGARRQAFRRARDTLFSKGIIGMQDDWVWLKGKSVIGFPSPPGVPASKRQAKPKAEAGATSGDTAPFAPAAAYSDDDKF